MEHLALHPGQRKDRDVDHGDDADTKQAGPNHLAGRGIHDLQPFLECQAAILDAVLGLGQTANAVLDHDDRTIDDQAEVECTQAHQVGRDAGAHHAGDRGQHGQRDDRSGNQGGPHITQQQEQDHDHQQRTLQQVLLDGGNGLVDQRGPVIQRLDVDALGQRAVDRFNPRRHILGDGP